MLVALIAGAELFARGYLANHALAFHAGAWLLAASLWFAARGRGPALRRIAVTAALLLGLVSAAELLPRSGALLPAPSFSFPESGGDPQALRLWWTAREHERRILSGDLPLEPGQRFAWVSAVVELDARGLRRAEPPRAGAYRIVVAGGSASFGATLTPGERPWPATLEEAIASRYACARPVAVRNAGRPGRTLQALTRSFDTEIAPLAPDLLVVYPGVDALEGFARGEALAAPAPPERASRWLRALERAWRERTAERALRQALTAPPRPDRLRRGVAARRYRRLLVVAGVHGIDVALGSLALAVDGFAPEAAIRFHESVWPETRRFIVANRAHGLLLPLLGVAYRAEVLDLSPDLDGAYQDACIDLVHPSAAGSERLARNAALALAPLLTRPDPGCVARARPESE